MVKNDILNCVINHIFCISKQQKHSIKAVNIVSVFAYILLTSYAGIICTCKNIIAICWEIFLLIFQFVYSV